MSNRFYWDQPIGAQWCDLATQIVDDVMVAEFGASPEIRRGLIAAALFYAVRVTTQVYGETAIIDRLAGIMIDRDCAPANLTGGVREADWYRMCGQFGAFYAEGMQSWCNALGLERTGRIQKAAADGVWDAVLPQLNAAFAKEDRDALLAAHLLGLIAASAMEANP